MTQQSHTAGWSLPSVISRISRASLSRPAASLYLPWSLDGCGGWGSWWEFCQYGAGGMVMRSCSRGGGISRRPRLWKEEMRVEGGWAYSVVRKGKHSLLFSININCICIEWILDCDRVYNRSCVVLAISTIRNSRFLYSRMVRRYRGFS